MKRVKFAAIAVFASIFAAPVAADVFRFDMDGGKCDTDMTYAEFGPEGMAWVDYGGDYIPDGSWFILNQTKLKNGLIAYEVSDVDSGFKTVIYLQPKRGYFTINDHYARNPADMDKEGLVDVAKLTPCK